MSICVLAAGKLLATFIAGSFTLGWTHSVQKTGWQEDWRTTPAGLELVEARVKGSGAGMEPGEGAVFDGVWWRYRPELPAIPKLMLARSGAEAAGAWRLCAAGRCEDFSGSGEPLEVRVCEVP